MLPSNLSYIVRLHRDPYPQSSPTARRPEVWTDEVSFACRRALSASIPQPQAREAGLTSSRKRALHLPPCPCPPPLVQLVLQLGLRGAHLGGAAGGLVALERVLARERVAARRALLGHGFEVAFGDVLWDVFEEHGLAAAGPAPGAVDGLPARDGVVGAEVPADAWVREVVELDVASGPLAGLRPHRPRGVQGTEGGEGGRFEEGLIPDGEAVG